MSPNQDTPLQPSSHRAQIQHDWEPLWQPYGQKQMTYHSQHKDYMFKACTPRLLLLSNYQLQLGGILGGDPWRGGQMGKPGTRILWNISLPCQVKATRNGATKSWIVLWNLTLKNGQAGRGCHA